jgi:hypothetical protein
MKCPDCGRSISEKAKACPHCGLPSPRREMLDWDSWKLGFREGLAAGRADPSLLSRRPEKYWKDRYAEGFWDGVKVGATTKEQRSEPDDRERDINNIENATLFILAVVVIALVGVCFGR